MALPKQTRFYWHFLCTTVLNHFFLLLLSRSVEDEERPFALGMQFVLLRTLGMSPNSQVCPSPLFAAGNARVL